MDLYTAVNWYPANVAGVAASSQYQRLADGRVLPLSAAASKVLPVTPQAALPSTFYGCCNNGIIRCGQ
jgi:hypothetical protein